MKEKSEILRKINTFKQIERTENTIINSNLNQMVLWIDFLIPKYHSKLLKLSSLFLMSSSKTLYI